MMLKRENYLQAKYALEKIIRIDQKSWVAYMMLSHVLYCLDDYESALFYILKAKELPGRNVNEIGETEKLAREIVAQDLRSQGLETMGSGEVEYAVEIGLLLLEVNPLDEYAIALIAVCYELLDDYESVIEHLDRFLATAETIDDPCNIHWWLFRAKKELNRFEDAKIHHDYLLENASEKKEPMLRFELAEYAFRQKQFPKARRLINEFERFIIVSDLPIEKKSECENKIWRARVGILRALGDENSVSQMGTKYLEELHNGSRECDYFCLLTILDFAEDRKDSELIREILKAGWMQQDEAEQICPSSKYFEGIISEWDGNAEHALECYKEVRNRTKDKCEREGTDFNEIWGIFCERSIDYADFELPTDELPFGSFIENKIKALSAANCTT